MTKQDITDTIAQAIYRLGKGDEADASTACARPNRCSKSTWRKSVATKSRPAEPVEQQEFVYRFICPPVQMSDVLLNSFSHKQPYFVVGFECFVLLSPEFLNVQDALEALQHEGIRAVVQPTTASPPSFSMSPCSNWFTPAPSPRKRLPTRQLEYGRAARPTSIIPLTMATMTGCVSRSIARMLKAESASRIPQLSPEGPGRLHDRYLVSGADEGQHRRIIERKFRNGIYVAAARPAGAAGGV